LALAIFVAGNADNEVSATNYKELQIHNHSGYGIEEIYLVHSGSPSWKENVITKFGYKSLENKKYMKLNYNSDYESWCFKIVFHNGATRVWDDPRCINLNGAWKIAISNTGEKEVDGRMIFAVSKNDNTLKLKQNR